ncbi:MAG: hypothetical protein V4568_01160 [Pseudomonadota bacterium]
MAKDKDPKKKMIYRLAKATKSFRRNPIDALNRGAGSLGKALFKVGGKMAEAPDSNLIGLALGLAMVITGSVLYSAYVVGKTSVKVGRKLLNPILNQLGRERSISLGDQKREKIKVATYTKEYKNGGEKTTSILNNRKRDSHLKWLAANLAELTVYGDYKPKLWEVKKFANEFAKNYVSPLQGSVKKGADVSEAKFDDTVKAGIAFYVCPTSGDALILEHPLGKKRHGTVKLLTKEMQDLMEISIQRGQNTQQMTIGTNQENILGNEAQKKRKKLTKY